MGKWRQRILRWGLGALPTHGWGWLTGVSVRAFLCARAQCPTPAPSSPAEAQWKGFSEAFLTAPGRPERTFLHVRSLFSATYLRVHLSPFAGSALPKRSRIVFPPLCTRSFWHGAWCQTLNACAWNEWNTEWQTQGILTMAHSFLCNGSLQQQGRPWDKRWTFYPWNVFSKRKKKTRKLE